MTAPRSLIVLVVAILMGAAAVFLINGYFSGVEQRNQKVAEDLSLKLVTVARVPLAFGDVITPDKVRLVQWPAGSVPAGTFPDIRAFSGSPQRVALRPIDPGEPILASKLAGPGGRATISALLPNDKRAVAIRLTDVAGVGGFVLPGDTVDVLLTRQAESGPGGVSNQITDLLLQHVRVIAIDQNSNENSKDPVVGRTVTVEVDTAQAQKLALAGQVGILSLALRNAADTDDPEAATVSIADLRADAVPSGRASYAPPVHIYRAPVRRAAAPAKTASVVRAADTMSIAVARGVKVSNVEVKP